MGPAAADLPLNHGRRDRPEPTDSRLTAPPASQHGLREAEHEPFWCQPSAASVRAVKQPPLRLRVGLLAVQILIGATWPKKAARSPTPKEVLAEALIRAGLMYVADWFRRRQVDPS